MTKNIRFEKSVYSNTLLKTIDIFRKKYSKRLFCLHSEFINSQFNQIDIDIRNHHDQHITTAKRPSSDTNIQRTDVKKSTGIRIQNSAYYRVFRHVISLNHRRLRLSLIIYHVFRYSYVINGRENFRFASDARKRPKANGLFRYIIIAYFINRNELSRLSVSYTKFVWFVEN